MKNAPSEKIRESYLKFFESQGHLRLPSYSLVPVNDPTLLIINAGMAPMKSYFKGEAEPPRRRVTTCQKCVRVGDIEQVGKTARHLTFFEMLGNFSFADYYKRETIKWAWEYVTDVLKIPAEKLYISVHTDDDEAEEIWNREVGIPLEKITRLEDNFWGPVGKTGPCGFCSELMVDQGEEFSCGKPDCKPGCDCDRYLEIWNLVFTGLFKNEDGEFEKLPGQCIDTGLGFERIVAYLQGKQSPYDTDLFENVMKTVKSICGKTLDQKDFRREIIITADHTRAATFMASDGITPSNEGRGYVMRRLIRRAVRAGQILGFEDHSLTELVIPLIEKFAPVYPELMEKKDYIISILGTEEKNFRRTLNQGVSILEGMLQVLKKEGKKVLSGKDMFTLYDTYGFPRELTQEIAREQGFEVEIESFQKALEEQRERARSDTLSKLENVSGDIDLSRYDSSFSGYHQLDQETIILEIFKDGQPVNSIFAGDK
ncbi:MAG: alanine--tRNA ligase, partial [Vulcanimicrobiota bacterium]